MKKTTIQSIAETLGFSRNTVSMALKGNDMVSPKTREIILKYADSIGYPRISQEVREEKGDEGAVYRIMILKKPDVAVYWDKIVNGISEEASRSHCQTQVAVVTEDEEREGRLPLGLNDTIQAAFCVKILKPDYIKKIKEKGVQVYMLDTCLRQYGQGNVYRGMKGEMLGDVIKPEGINTTMELVHHLLDQGMKRIGFLNDSSSIYETMHDRYSGYVQAMRQAGIVSDPRIVLPDVKSSNFYEDRVFEKVVESYPQMPEAVVCGNDMIAKFLTQALRRKGLRVPEDVALTGFDNDEDGILDPFFTTVYVDAKWLGRRMVQCFLRRMQFPDAPYEKIVVQGEVIIRKSSFRPGGE
jgi:Transcriptional regulators